MRLFSSCRSESGLCPPGAGKHYEVHAVRSRAEDDEKHMDSLPLEMHANER